MKEEYEKYKELYKEAMHVSQNGYAPYSHFCVGAAVLTESGRIFKGVNVENASYGMTICAERSAVSAAVTAGERDIRAVAVASSGGMALPCGACRQVLLEFGDDMEVITGKDEEHIEVYSIRELLPKGFKL